MAVEAQHLKHGRWPSTKSPHVARNNRVPNPAVASQVSQHALRLRGGLFLAGPSATIGSLPNRRRVTPGHVHTAHKTSPNRVHF
jgi:hypothetical protein